MTQQRILMAMIGALAGGSLYLLFRLELEGVLVDRAALGAMTLAGVFFISLLALFGPMGLGASALRAAGQAIFVAGLVLWASLRFDTVDQIFWSPLAVVSALVLTFIPMPFFIAASGPGWRDYPALFSAAWGVVMRSTVAWVFVAILWAVIYLSHALLSLVGIGVIEEIVTLPPAPWLITGTAFGLAMAVALELAEVVSAYLVLRLLRLLVPVVLPVMAVFLVAVAINGFGSILDGFSVSAILLVMAGVAATLVTSAVDQSDTDATQNTAMRRATQVLAAILILPAGIALWAMWVRVQSYGSTPDRLFGITAAVLGLGYGVTYLVAILRGATWMERIRQANIWMALAMMAISALWLTPVLNPERISAGSQLARFASGPLDKLDPSIFNDLGLAGRSARAALDDMAKTNPDLAKKLAEVAASEAPVVPADLAGLRAELTKTMPIQPASAAPLRDQILALADEPTLKDWQSACAVKLPKGGPGCAMVVGDFIPAILGDEALVVLRYDGGYLNYSGVAIVDGALQMLMVDSADGELQNYQAGEDLLGQLQTSAPSLRPVPRNELPVQIGGALSMRP